MVALPVKIKPANVGVDVVVTLWSMEDVPNKYNELLLPKIVAE